MTAGTSAGCFGEVGSRSEHAAGACLSTGLLHPGERVLLTHGEKSGVSSLTSFRIITVK
jgi:hypothetical protein